MWFYKGGKCGCFVLIKNDIIESKPPNVQSDFTCNPTFACNPTLRESDFTFNPGSTIEKRGEHSREGKEVMK